MYIIFYYNICGRTNIDVVILGIHQLNSIRFNQNFTCDRGNGIILLHFCIQQYFPLHIVLTFFPMIALTIKSIILYYLLASSWWGFQFLSILFGNHIRLHDSYILNIFVVACSFFYT